MNKQESKLLENIGSGKARYIRRLCTIMDNKGERYNVEELMKKSREDIMQLINDKLDYPYQRFDA